MPLITAFRSRQKKIKTATSCIFLLFSISFCNGQNSFSLKVKVSNMPYAKLYLTSIYGHQQRIVDSAAINKEGIFQLALPGLSKGEGLGLYRIVLGKTAKATFKNEEAQSFAIILNHENTVLSTNFNAPTDSMQVIEGAENKLYYAYLKKKKLCNQKLDLLDQMFRFYPEKDSFYIEIQKQYNNLQTEFTSYTANLIQHYPQSYVARLVKAEQYPFLDASLTEALRLKELKNNFFKSSDFQDTLLLYSNVLSDKILTYINLYRNEYFTEQQQTDEFIRAVNHLMTIAQTGQSKVMRYTLEYITAGFNEIKQEAVLAYIADTYITASSCVVEDERLKNIFRKTADYKRTAIGAEAPGIKALEASSGSSEGVGKEPANIQILWPASASGKRMPEGVAYTVIVFWASWCPHCTAEVPKIKKVMENILEKYPHRSMAAVFISLDNEEKPWKDFIEKNELSGYIHICEFKGWNGQIGRDYNVYATPALFLLDKHKKIIAKPENAEQLMNSIYTISDSEQ
ncbi:MAG: TlpA disulfide reductase family protein [Bacteroidia bacterium]